MKHLYFVRHGLSEMNKTKQWSGHTNTPLAPEGKIQASEAGKWARDNGIVFDIIVSSPLDRAHDTAKAIAEHVGYNHSNIILHEDLKERHFGIHEGAHSSTFPVTFEVYSTDPFSIDHLEGVEKITDMQFRANRMLEHLHTLPHETILVVSHGAFGRALRRAVENSPLTEFGEKFENAEIIKLI